MQRIWHVSTVALVWSLESFEISFRGGRKMVAGSAGCRECWHVNPFPTSRGGTELCSLGRVAYIWKSSPPHTIHTQKIIAPFNSFPTHGTHSDSSQSIHNRTGADMCWQWLLTGVPTNLEHCANMQMLVTKDKEDLQSLLDLATHLPLAAISSHPRGWNLEVGRFRNPGRLRRQYCSRNELIGSFTNTTAEQCVDLAASK